MIFMNIHVLIRIKCDIEEEVSVTSTVPSISSQYLNSNSKAQPSWSRSLVCRSSSLAFASASASGHARGAGEHIPQLRLYESI